MKKFVCHTFLVITLNLCTATVSANSKDFGPVDMADFYTDIPNISTDAKLGEIIISEEIPSSSKDIRVWKIAYVSSDVNENKTIATGIIAAPIGLHSNRPIVAWAHGTTGTAQNCGPSQILNPAQPLNQYFMPSGNSWTDFGLPAMKKFIKAGYVIVATDYQGLGGGGRHQYTVAATQARDVINSIRAVSSFAPANAGTKAIIYGWSQGGGASIAAAGLTEYLATKGSARDDIKLVGFVAMAPYDIGVMIPNGKISKAEATKFLTELSNSFAGNIFNFTHYAQNTWGMVNAFDNLSLNDLFTEEGAEIINKILLRKCMHVASDTLNHNYGQNFKNLLRTDIKNASAWVDAHKKSSVLPVKPMAPVIIYYGNNDTTVPPVMGKLYSEQMLKLQGDVTRVELPGKQDHFSTPAAAEPLYVKWVAERFANEK